MLLVTQSVRKIIAVAVMIFAVQLSHSQTDMDAIMMNKNQFCNGFMYNYSSWDNYWEGTLKRNNLNLGKVSSQSITYMANYGITDNLNVMVMAPYVWTKASAGTLTGLTGLQDIAAIVKWRPVVRKMGNHKIQLFVMGGVSTPLSDYVVDFQPLSIGLGSTNATLRGMVDYQWKRWTASVSAAYVRRSNVTLDRPSYYDTEMRLTDEVKMPDASQYQLRTGYRGKYLLAEALLTNWTTLGGFDITRNNMPFPSNKMNATMIGASFKYTLPAHVNLSFLAGTNYTVAGRNMGQSLAFNGGIFYQFYFGKRTKNKTSVNDN